MSAHVEIQLIAIVVAIMCSLPGIFLVLRKMAMMSDSITHTILLGIVIGFFITNDLSSPLLIIGATLMGVVTAWLTETINKTRLVSEDASIGIVFPLLFSIAVILITRYAGSVHLDTDSILLGELAFAPFDRITIFGYSMPNSLLICLIILIVEVIIISLFFKELTIATFDPILAGLLGFSPVIMHYCIMTMVSVSAVGAFQAVGSVLVVAFMVGPAITAYLLTSSIKNMILICIVDCIVSCVIGFRIAILCNVSIAGCIAVVIGVIFFIVLLISPSKGIIFNCVKKLKQKQVFSQDNMMIHLYQSIELSKEDIAIEEVHQQLCWKKSKVETVVNQLTKKDWIRINNGMIQLTKLGIEHTKLADAAISSQMK